MGSAAPGPDWGRVAAGAASSYGRGEAAGANPRALPPGFAPWWHPSPLDSPTGCSGPSAYARPVGGLAASPSPAPAPTSRKFPTPTRSSQHRPRCAAGAQQMSLSSPFSPRDAPHYDIPLPHHRRDHTWSPSSNSGLRGGAQKWEEPSENRGHFVPWDPGVQRRQGKYVKQRERSPDLPVTPHPGRRDPPRPAAGAEPCRGPLSAGRPAGPAPPAPGSRSSAEWLRQQELEDAGPQQP